jgi:predicted Na+-dependent transporter
MAFFGRDFAGWFGSAVELAFAFVFFESHRKKVAKSVAAVASSGAGGLLCYSASFVILPDEKPTC